MLDIVKDHQISFKGMGNDIGIFSNESLTALYTGNNLTITDIEDMVLGLVWDWKHCQEQFNMV